MPQPQPAHQSCPERHRLLDSIEISSDRIAALRSMEVEAFRKHEIAWLEKIWQDFERAMVLNESLLEEFKEHVQAHGCQQQLLASYGTHAVPANGREIFTRRAAAKAPVRRSATRQRGLMRPNWIDHGTAGA